MTLPKRRRNIAHITRQPLVSYAPVMHPASAFFSRISRRPSPPQHLSPRNVQEEEGSTAPPVIVDDGPPNTSGGDPNAVSVKDIQGALSQAALYTHLQIPEPLHHHTHCAHGPEPCKSVPRASAQASLALTLVDRQSTMWTRPCQGRVTCSGGPRGPPGSVLRVVICSSTLRRPVPPSFALAATNSAR